MKTGTLYIVAAPSGGGKTSLVNALIKEVSNLAVSVSYTTRPKRPGEEDTIDYFFVTPKQFAGMIERNEFLEHATVFGYEYGTSKLWVDSQLDRGIDIILEIDWQGAKQIRALFPNSVNIFIVPPSLGVLEQRLVQRAQDDDATIKARMDQARNEISHLQEFDYLIINDDFIVALQQLESIIRAKRCETKRQSANHRALLAKLI